MVLKTFRELYKKDLKEIESVTITFFVFQVFINVLMFFIDIPPRSILQRSLSFMIAMTVYAQPFILAYLYRSEWSTRSNYQALSLPVSRIAIVLSRNLAVFTSCAFLSACSFVWAYHISLRALLLDPSVPEYVIRDILRQPLFYFSVTFVFLGMISLIEAVQYTVKRYKEYVWGGMFIVCAYCYFRAGSHLIDFFDRKVWLLWSGLEIEGIVYSLAVGLLFLLAGLIAFEKYGEV